jgi:hypothetical protein
MAGRWQQHVGPHFDEATQHHQAVTAQVKWLLPAQGPTEGLLNDTERGGQYANRKCANRK